MIRSELIARIAARNPHLSAKNVEALVTTLLDRIAEALAKGDRVELRGFGTFYILQRGARIGRNPRTGEAVRVKPKASVQFRPGKAMQERLNPVRAGSEAGAGTQRLLRAS